MRKENSDKEGHLLLTYDQNSLNLLKVVEFNNFIDIDLYTNPLRGRPILPVNKDKDNTGVSPDLLIVYFANGRSWDLNWMDFTTKKTSGQKASISDPYTLDHDDSKIRPRMTEIVQRSYGLYLGGYILKGDDHVALISVFNHTDQTLISSEKVEASDVASDGDIGEKTGVIVDRLQFQNHKMIALFAFTDSENVGQLKKFKRPISLLAFIVPPTGKHTRKIQFIKLELHNSTITQDLVHQTRLLGFQLGEKNLRVYYYTTDKKEDILSIHNNSLWIQTAYQDKQNSQNNKDYSRMIQYFEIVNTFDFSNDGPYLADDSIKNSIQNKNQQYFQFQSGEGQMPIGNSKTFAGMLTPRTHITPWISVKCSHCPQVYQDSGEDEQTEKGKLSGGGKGQGQGQGNKDMTPLKFQAYDIGTGKLQVLPSGLKHQTTTDYNSDIPDCSSVKYTATPKTGGLAKGLHAVQVFETETESKKNEFDLEPHASFKCAVSESDCNKCPLFIEWFWQNGPTQTLIPYSQKAGYRSGWNSPMWRQSVNLITSESGSKLKFALKKVATNNGLTYAATPTVQWTVMMKYLTDMSSQTLVAPYTQIISARKVMKYPACQQYAAFKCKGGSECYGQFVKNQIYNFPLIEDAKTMCFEYRGKLDECMCGKLDDHTTDDFKAVFYKLPSCPYQLMDDDITIDSKADELKIVIDRQDTNLAFKLGHVVKWQKAATIINNMTASAVEKIPQDDQIIFSFQSDTLNSTLKPQRKEFVLKIVSVSQKHSISDFREYQFEIGATYMYKTLDQLAEANFPREVTPRYPRNVFKMKIRVDDCSKQEIIEVEKDKTLDIPLLYGKDPVEILPEKTLEKLFTVKMKDQCSKYYYDIRTDDADKTDPSTAMKEQFQLTLRSTKKFVNITADPPKFDGYLKDAVEDKYNYTFYIIAHHRKSTGTYPSAYKKVNLMINFYDCTGKQITSFKQEESYKIIVDPANATIDIDYSKFFNNTDERCLIKEIYLREDKDGITNLNNTVTNAFDFQAANQKIVVKNELQNKGTWGFYIFARTRTYDKASIKLNFNLIPCKQGVAQISPPKDYSKVKHFSSVLSDGVVLFKIEYLNLTDKEKDDKKVIIEIPRFSNSEKELCPITHKISSSKTSVVKVEKLIFKEDEKVNKITIPLQYTDQSFQAYIKAENKFNYTVWSPLFKFEAESLCTSYIAKLMKDETVNKTYQQVNYLHLIQNKEIPLQTSIFKSFIDATKLNELKIKDCPLKMKTDKDISIKNDLKEEIKGKQLEENVYEYSLGDNIMFKFYTKELNQSTFTLNLTQLEKQGFNEKYEFTFQDNVETKLKITFEFAMCGKDFKEETICTEEIPDDLPVNFPPSIDAPQGLSFEIPDLYSDFISNPDSENLQQLIPIGKITDIEEQEVKVKTKAETGYSSIINIIAEGVDVSIKIDMKQFYSSGLMADWDSPVETSVTVNLNDGQNEVEKEIKVKFTGRTKPDEEEPEPEPEPDNDDDNKSTINFNLNVKKKEVEAKNEPVAVAPAAVPKTERKSPQIASILVDGTGIATFTFTQPMMYPLNWIKKYMSDNGLSEVDEALIDSIQVPFIEFLYEQAGQETPFKQLQLPQKDIKISSLEALSINFQISFDSLDDPKSVSLIDSVTQDNLIVEVSKKIILNGQAGESLVLDSADFDEEDGSSFYLTVSIEPQKVEAESKQTENLQNTVDSSPAVTAASTAGGLLGSVLGGAPPTEMSDDLKSEQDSASESALKAIAPGQVNGFNQKMQKAAGCDYKQIDFLSARNMTWTSQPPESETVKRMGVKTKNFPKNMGSTMLGGAGTMIVGNAGGAALQAAAGALPFEGGQRETINFAAQVKQFKKKYKASMKAPMTPTYNAIIGMFFLKILLGGIVNCQNGYLIEWKNFGPNGTLSVGDQISIIVGYLGLLVAFIIFGMLVINLMGSVSWMFNFGKKVQGVENILRRKTNHKWFLFTMGQFKTFVTIYIIVFYSTANFAVPQMMLGLILNPANLFLGLQLKPLPKFYGIDLNTVAQIGDVSAILIVYMKLSITDINRDPTVTYKLDIGWIVLILGQIKFFVGKFKLGSTQWLHHKKKIEALKSCLCPCLYDKKEQAITTDSDQYFNEFSRRNFIDQYKLRYKEKFYKLNKLDFAPRNFNKVAPIEAFRPAKKKKDQNQNMYHKKQERKLNEAREKFKPGKMCDHLHGQCINEAHQVQMSKITENSMEESSLITGSRDSRLILDSNQDYFGSQVTNQESTSDKNMKD